MNTQKALNLRPIGEICKDIAQVLFASVFIPSLTGEIPNPITATTGLLSAVLLWVVYVFLHKELKQ